MKILSIVIPTYNMEKYLDKCLSSLIVSDLSLLQKLEVLVINDGSKDRSSSIAHSYENKYHNIVRVIDKENGNYGSCINRGLKEASGKYIKVLDADDYFDTCAFQDYMRVLCSLDVDVVLNDMVQISPMGEIKYQTKFDLDSDIECDLNDFMCLRKCEMWMHCVCYRTENLRALSYHQTEGISYTDQEWIGLPMANSQRLYYCNRVLYYYLVGRDGQTVNTQNWNLNFWQELKGMKVMLQELKTIGSNISDLGKEYMKWRVSYRLKIIYSAYLIYFRKLKDINKERMKEFDLFLSLNYPALWKEVDSTVLYGAPHFNYHPVSDWRKNYKRKIVKIAFIDSYNFFRGRLYTVKCKLSALKYNG